MLRGFPPLVQLAFEVVAPVRITGLELHRPGAGQRPAAAPGSCAHVHRAPCPTARGIFGFGLVGHKAPVRNTIVLIGLRYDVALVDLAAHQRTAAMRFLIVPIDRPCSNQSLTRASTCFGFNDRAYSGTPRMQFVRGACQDVLAIVLRGITALPALTAELFEVVVQAFQSCSP